MELNIQLVMNYNFKISSSKHKKEEYNIKID